MRVRKRRFLSSVRVKTREFVGTGFRVPRFGSVLVITICLVFVLSAGVLTARTDGGRSFGTQIRAQLTSQFGLHFDYLVILVMGNHAICDILTSCGGNGSYTTALAEGYGLAAHYVGCKATDLPNYLCLTGGSDFGCARYGGGPNSNNCTRAAWNATNIVDRLESAGLTWKAYLEGIPSNCYGSDSGSYLVRHNPFVYYGDIARSAARCARVVPAGRADSALLSDLGSPSNASNYMWITPNACNGMYYCPIETGDAYLSHLVLPILTSNVFRTQRAALFLTFDQDSGGAGHPNLLTVWAGPAAAARYNTSRFYNHSSLLATIETNWNLPPLTSSDGNARDMAEFFTNPAGPDKTPPQITVTSPADRSVLSPATITVTGTASDDIGVGRVEISTDGGNWTLANGTTSWSAAADLVIGNNTIFARATDLSGNRATVAVAVTGRLLAQGGLLDPGFLVVAVPLAAVAATLVVLVWRRRRES